jgi:hypothetical protein
VSAEYVIGYDPGGNGKHGVAALRVEQRDGSWIPLDLTVATARYINDVVGWVVGTTSNGRIVAAGVDTLTEWNSGHSGFRPADRWLTLAYPAMARSVVAPASLYGSMVIGGAGSVLLLRERFQGDGTMLTEAHPKVCYYALTGEKPKWREDREKMTGWLLREFTVGSRDDICVADDHRFDAATAALAALRGLNGDWTLDLHALPDTDQAARIQFYGNTHYWWPHNPSRTP